VIRGIGMMAWGEEDITLMLRCWLSAQISMYMCRSKGKHSGVLELLWQCRRCYLAVLEGTEHRAAVAVMALLYTVAYSLAYVPYCSKLRTV